MSRQFGHNNNSARQPHPHAGTPGLQPLGLQGQVGPAGVGVPIQLQGGIQGDLAGNALPGATVSAIGAYGSPGSNFTPQQGQLNAARLFSIVCARAKPTPVPTARASARSCSFVPRYWGASHASTDTNSARDSTDSRSTDSATDTYTARGGVSKIGPNGHMETRRQLPVCRVAPSVTGRQRGVSIRGRANGSRSLS